MIDDGSSLFSSALARTRPFQFLQDGQGAPVAWSADRLLGLASACARLFQRRGLEPGRRIVFMLPTGPELVAGIFAAWGCGAVVALMPHAVAAGTGRLKVEQWRELIALIGPALIVHDGLTEDAARSVDVGILDRITLGALDPTGRAFPEQPASDDFAHIQLTSGSTGLPKGVPLRHAQLASNYRDIARRAQVASADHMVSWVPLHHDMGFAALHVSVITDAHVTLLPPERFVRKPVVWLETMSVQHGTVAPTAAFALPLLARHSAGSLNLPIDLSSWRHAWIGAEPVFAPHVEAFAASMRQHGLRENVLQPTYGMAESVVGVSSPRCNALLQVIHVDANSLRARGEVNCVEKEAVGAIPFASNGFPLDSIRVRIVDDGGSTLPPDREGRILIAGPSVAAGYLNGVDAERFHDGGWFDTGDVGFLHDGEIYVSGRSKDVIIRGGVNISAHHVEWSVEQALSLGPGQVIAFANLNHAESREELVILVGVKNPLQDTTSIRQEVARTAAREGAQADRILVIRRNLIPRTTSGKVQRGLARRMYNAGAFADGTKEPA